MRAWAADAARSVNVVPSPAAMERSSGSIDQPLGKDSRRGGRILTGIVPPCTDIRLTDIVDSCPMSIVLGVAFAVIEKSLTVMVAELSSHGPVPASGLIPVALMCPVPPSAALNRANVFVCSIMVNLPGGTLVHVGRGPLGLKPLPSTLNSFVTLTAVEGGASAKLMVEQPGPGPASSTIIIIVNKRFELKDITLSSSMPEQHDPVTLILYSPLMAELGISTLIT